MAYSAARRKSPMEPLDVLSVPDGGAVQHEGQNLITGAGMVSSTLQKDLTNYLNSVFDSSNICWRLQKDFSTESSEGDLPTQAIFLSLTKRRFGLLESAHRCQKDHIASVS